MELKEYIKNHYKRMFRDPIGSFKYPCLLPVAAYNLQLWDWGCWLSNIAVRQIALDLGELELIEPYEKGCVLNFLDAQKEDGSIPICIAYKPEGDLALVFPNAKNVHKPVIAQHAALICKYTKDASWIKDGFSKLEKFIKFYEDNAKHESGLFYFFDDFAIGCDNDPCTFYRPNNSSASIFINTLMYKELGAMSFIAGMLNLKDKEELYSKKQQELKDAINKCCYDEKDGMYYSCDINLRKIDKNELLHSTAPRNYSTLIQRIGFWSAFMPLWAGIPTQEQANRIVKENLLREDYFWCKAGVRGLNRLEKMYNLGLSMNPSNWQGTAWGLSNYMIYKGLLRYGFKKEALELAHKTIDMFESDIKNTGAMHEYYDPDTAEGIFNKDFLSWNMLAYNMLAYLNNEEVIEEY